MPSSFATQAIGRDVSITIFTASSRNSGEKLFFGRGNYFTFPDIHPNGWAVRKPRGTPTWYLATNLSRPGGPREAGSPHPAAGLAEVTRIYGIRHWIEQGYKQVKDELGWADFQVRSDIAIRRHQVLVNCAFSFCWDAWFADHPPRHDVAAPQPEPGGGERGAARHHAGLAAVVLAPGAQSRPRLAFPVDRIAALVGRMVQGAPAPQAPGTARRRRCRPRTATLYTQLTNYR